MNDDNSPDALMAALANETEDVIRAADALLKAAGGDDVSTLARASALVKLAAVNARLDAVLDELSGFTDALPDGAG